MIEKIVVGPLGPSEVIADAGDAGAVTEEVPDAADALSDADVDTDVAFAETDAGDTDALEESVASKERDQTLTLV